MPASSRPAPADRAAASAPPASTTASNVAPQLADRHVDADVGVGAELDALLAHQREPPLEPPLFELELRNAVAEQAADAIGALEHGDRVAGAIQLIGRGEAGGPDPTTATRLPVRAPGGCATIHPSSNARSTIAFSMP